MSLRSRTVQSAATSSAQVASFLLVTCGDTHLAISADIVRGIVKPDETGVNDALAVLGVRSSVTDLGERLGLSWSALSSEARIVVCGMHRARQAFRVSMINGLEEIETTTITPLLPQFTGPERQWFTGMFVFRDIVALVVGAGWLLSENHKSRRTVEHLVTDEHKETVSAAAPVSLIGNLKADAGQYDVVQLEEATDADDLPWAEL